MNHMSFALHSPSNECVRCHSADGGTSTCVAAVVVVKLLKVIVSNILVTW